MHVGELLGRHAGRPRGTDLPDARRTIQRVLAMHLRISISSLVAFPEREVDDETVARFEADLEALERGRPEAHILGTVPFLDWEFHCDARALIPRPETEALAGLVLRLLHEHRPPYRVLDLCCGGGVLGLSMALSFPDAYVVLSDSSAEALALCGENITRHQLGGRTQLLEGNLWEPIPLTRFDLIVANPPYVAAEDEVSASVLQWEPRDALYSSDRGMAHIKAILTSLGDYLARDGLAAFELGHAHYETLTPWLLKLKLSGAFLWEKDPYGVRRYLIYDPSGRLPGTTRD